MNLQYIRYALEIARTGSISKAAENLSVAQPNLSRAVKELEGGLGIAIFERTRTGMAVTPDGERLLSAGERILREIGELESMFEGDAAPRESLSLVFPHAAYIAHALGGFTRDLSADGHYDLIFREVDAQGAVNIVANGESRLGILRIPLHNEAYYAERLAERELAFEKIAKLPTVLVTRASFPASTVGRDGLKGLTAVSAKDLPIESEGLPPRRIQADAPETVRAILSSDASTYAFSLPLPPEALTDGLRQYALADQTLVPTSAWLDLLIFPKFYKLSPLDRRLLTQLQSVAAKCLSE